MTSISIIGAGRAATLHAAAATMADDIDLVGIAGRRVGAAAELSQQAETNDLSIEQAIDRSDAIVVAVPPADAPAVLATIGSRVGAVLVETPSARSTTELCAQEEGPPTMIAANLLHAPATRRALSIVSRMAGPHHFALTCRMSRPDWGCHATPGFGGGAILDPGCRVLPILLGALAAPVVTVSAKFVTGDDRIDTSASLKLVTDQESQRDVVMNVLWDGEATSVSLEVASDDAVVQLELSPEPTLEVNGEAAPLMIYGDPFFDLGYVDQIIRLGAVSQGDAAPWPGYELAAGLLDIAAAAAFSSNHQGLATTPGVGYPQRPVWNLLGGA